MRMVWNAYGYLKTISSEERTLPQYVDLRCTAKMLKVIGENEPLTEPPNIECEDTKKVKVDSKCKRTAMLVYNILYGLQQIAIDECDDEIISIEVSWINNDFVSSVPFSVIIKYNNNYTNGIGFIEICGLRLNNADALAVENAIMTELAHIMKLSTLLAYYEEI